MAKDVQAYERQFCVADLGYIRPPAINLLDPAARDDELTAAESVQLQHTSSRAGYDPWEGCVWAESYQGGFR